MLVGILCKTYANKLVNFVNNISIIIIIISYYKVVIFFYGWRRDYFFKNSKQAKWMLIFFYNTLPSRVTNRKRETLIGSDCSPISPSESISFSAVPTGVHISQRWPCLIREEMTHTIEGKTSPQYFIVPGRRHLQIGCVITGFTKIARSQHVKNERKFPHKVAVVIAGMNEKRYVKAPISLEKLLQTLVWAYQYNSIDGFWNTNNASLFPIRPTIRRASCLAAQFIKSGWVWRLTLSHPLRAQAACCHNASNLSPPGLPTVVDLAARIYQSAALLKNIRSEAQRTGRNNVRSPQKHRLHSNGVVCVVRR